MLRPYFAEAGISESQLDPDWLIRVVGTLKENLVLLSQVGEISWNLLR